MAIVKTWKIMSLQIMNNFVNLQNIVASATWQLTATYYDDLGREISIARHNSITYLGLPEDNNFIPFENLTEEQVVAWVKTVLGDSKVQEYEIMTCRHAIANITSEEINLTMVDVPWAT
jgi:hypothetical protein